MLKELTKNKYQMDQAQNSNEDTRPANAPAPNSDIIVFDGVYNKANPENSSYAIDKQLQLDSLEAQQADFEIPSPPPPLTFINTIADHLPPPDEPMLSEQSNTTTAQQLVSGAQLTPEQKKELVDKYNHSDYLQVGTFVDAHDSTHQYLFAQVVELDQNGLAWVCFDGWSKKWNSWLKIKSIKIAPFRSQAEGYSGQKKVAIRADIDFSHETLVKHHQKVLQLIESNLEGLSAFDFTQFVRGELFVYIDFLLGHSYTDLSALPSIEIFLKTILRFIVVWLAKLPTLKNTFDELEKLPLLFLVDSQAAIVKAYPELMETLQKLFGGCLRALRFFCFYDLDQETPRVVTKQVVDQNLKVVGNTFGEVVRDMTEVDFQSARQTNEITYNPELSRHRVHEKKDLEFGLLLNWVQFFADLGGFDAILAVLSMGIEDEKATKAPFSLISYLTKPFVNLNLTLNQEFANTFAERVGNLTVKRLQGMSEKEVKNCSKDQVDHVLRDLNKILAIGMNQNECALVVETTELFIALRFLKSSNLEKRLKGLQDIKFMIERVVKTQRNAYIRNKAFNQWKNSSDVDMETTKIPETGYFNCPLMCNWLKENKVIEIIIGEGAHIEVVRRCDSILKFAAKNAQDYFFDAAMVDLIWRCQQGKHEETVRAVYKLIQDVMPDLSVDVIDLFFAKVEQTKIIDEKFLLFLKEFSIIAFHKQIYTNEQTWANEIESKSTSTNNDYTTDFDVFLNMQETLFINQIVQHISSTTHSTSLQYGMPLFWQLCIDSSDESQEKKQLSLTCLTEMFKQAFRKTNRLHYLALAINQLVNNTSLVHSSVVIRAVIESYTIDQNQRNAGEDDQLIKKLQEEINIVDAVVQALNSYHELVRQKMKTMESVGTFYEQIFVGMHSHEQTIKEMLTLLEYLLSSNSVCLGIHNIKLLWQIFVEEPNYTLEQAMFLNWINKSYNSDDSSTNYVRQTEMFTIEEKKFLFNEILCNSVTKTNASLPLAKCFNHYFKQINKALKTLKLSIKKTRVFDFSGLTGLNSLWEISLKAENAKVRELCSSLLVEMHLKLEEPDENVTAQFVNQCMDNANEEGMVSLLSLFMDHYEGKKELKPEMNPVQRVQNFKPFSLQVISQMDSNLANSSTKAVSMNYYQSLGYLRQQIAESFGFQQNEFLMIIKNQIIDPELEDEKLMKDIPGMFSTVQLRRNTIYNPLSHPKFLISNNNKYFERIFDMLQTSTSQSKADQVWDLIQKLPVNQYLQQNLLTLEQMESSNSAWGDFLSPNSIFNLYYCLKILTKNFRSDTTGQWTQRFVDLGGLHHLIDCLVKLKINAIESMLTLKCLGDLISIVQKLISERVSIIGNLPRGKIISRILEYIEMICDFSLQKEIARGESFEQILRRIDNAKLKKTRQKMLMSGNKADTKKNEEQDNDVDSDDKKLHQNMLKQFKDQAEVVNDLFKFLNLVAHKDLATLEQVIQQHSSLEKILRKGILQSENALIRQCVANRTQEMLFPTEPYTYYLPLVAYKICVIQYQLQIVKDTLQHEQRCEYFFKHLAWLINTISSQDLQWLKNEVFVLISELVQVIIQREIKERNTQDRDFFLQGHMTLLASLLQKFPHQKLEAGKLIMQYLLKDCLFEIPHGNKDDQKNCAPKCKSTTSRQVALNLINVLSRDCLQNLSQVLDYLQNFNKKATWRTKKDHDWAVKLYDDEKSTTGRVGIKNLGCICYMNSLNQQLFMIPGFRNDILSIQDPNHNKNSDEDNMFLQWQTLFSGLLLSEKMYCNPKGYCHAFKDWEGNPVNVFEQMDVEEYLAMFLDRLESAIKGTPQEKTIQYHFGGQLANDIICKTCPHQFDTSEKCLTLGVPVKNKKSIYEGMDAFVQGDMLDEGNQYFCAKCDKKVDALKRTCIKTLPRYLIMTFKRFEFDFDSMQRQKVNDYFEFPSDLDMSKYTQEYLNKAAKSTDFKLKHPAEYYNFDLVGVVVHNGTADSGHYYSYIKEQERFTEQEQWFEFNDIWVREFDKNDLANECYGGEETLNFGNWSKNTMNKSRNAYIVVYKRKLEEMPPDSDEEIEKAVVKKSESLGQVQLSLESGSDFFNKIASKNHKYWQSRYIFSSEYTEFVCNLLLNWNTNIVIVANQSYKNNDAHLYQQMGTQVPLQQITPMLVQNQLDVKLPLYEIYTTKEVMDGVMEVFKFATAHYLNVMQRDDNKLYLPNMVKYLKAYMNQNIECARWFLNQFVNLEIIKENLFENGQQYMRSILAGLMYCAMLKVFEDERASINYFWDDIESNKLPARQTTLGNFILSVITILPMLKKYNSYQSQVLQILARFSTLGAESRSFLIRGQCLERLLNYFYWECSPYHKEYLEAPQLPFDLNTNPDIGLPTPEIAAKKTTFAMLKEQNRLKRIQTEYPKHQYLIETISNLARSIQNQQNIHTTFQLEQTEFIIGEHDQVLFLPSHEFLEKLFFAATKPRVAQSLSKAYLHHAIADDSLALKLWQTVKFGLTDSYEHNKIRPYLILLEHLIQGATHSKYIASQVDSWLVDLFRNVIGQHQRFFQWMEVMFDFVWKLYTRYAQVRQWMQQRHEVWEFMREWLDKNREPPVQYANQQNQTFRMNRTRAGKLNLARFDKLKNLVLYYYRSTIFNNMKNNADIDLSNEIDLDALCVQDYKFCAGTHVDILDDRFGLIFCQGIVQADLDEIIQVRFQNDQGQEQTQWILTHKCKVYPQSILEKQYKHIEMQRIKAVLVKKAQKEAEEKQAMELQNEQQRAVYQPVRGQGYNAINDDRNDNDDDDDEDDEEGVGQGGTNTAELHDLKNSSAPASQPNGPQDANNAEFIDNLVPATDSDKNSNVNSNYSLEIDDGGSPANRSFDSPQHASGGNISD